MIYSIKLKPIICFILVIALGVLCSYFLVGATKASTNGKINYTIVIDAGHGGIDGGSTGINSGITESEINLKVTKKLEKLLTGFGFNVVLTRKDSNGLYSITAPNKKQDDMKKRKEIIEKAKPNMVVSIHMNSFINSYEKGAQTFYLTKNLVGKELADFIQTEMVTQLVDARKNSNFDDLYMLKCYDCPSVIVEGGFLSNPAEEKLLIQDEYQSKIAYSVFCGVVKYFEKVSDIK